jgi:hypothetical protein
VRVEAAFGHAKRPCQRFDRDEPAGRDRIQRGLLPILSGKPIVSELMPGYAAYRLWGRDEHPTFPDDGSSRRADAYFPPRDGSRFQNGTRHAWRNHGTETCMLVGVAVGADRT